MASSTSIPTFDPTATPYPKARRDEDHVDIYQSAKRGKVEIEDPYHWLEVPPSESAETKAWVDAQVEFCEQTMAQNPDRQAFKEALTKNWNYPKFSAPALMDDGRYYMSYNTGLQNQYPFYRFNKSELPNYGSSEGPFGELFFDPNLLSEDGTISLAASSFSKSGKFWAYGLSKSGSDWYTAYVRSTEGSFEGVDDARKLGDKVEFVKHSSLTWTHDDKGFFYQRFPQEVSDDNLGTATASDQNAMIYYHRIGTDQSTDILVYSRPDEPTYIFGLQVTTDGKYAILSTARDTSTSALMHVAELGDGGLNGEAYKNLNWREIVGEWGSIYSCFANDGPKFYFSTNKDAKNYKIQTCDISNDKLVFEDLIKEDDKAVLSSISAVNENSLVLVYSRDVKDELYLYDLKGNKIKRLLPDFVGSVSGVRCKRQHDKFFLSISSYTNPGAVYVFDYSTKGETESKDVELLKETKMELKSNDFISVQEFYESKDGTKIPVTITRHKDVKLNGSAPLMLYGYGGFNISLDPRFSVTWMTWVHKYRGVLAVPNIRGGGEYGDGWHTDGVLDKKQNSYDDFLAAAEYLVKEGYTSEGKIIMNGGSNGGLLVAACTNQARDGLIGASVADVGVLDLLKFHKWTIGRLWTSDYGNPDKPEDFDFILPISPVHNIDPKKVLPPYLITTADHDDRVVPAHSFKMAATLQHTLAENPNPLVIRIDVKAGHGGGKPTAKIIDEACDKFGWASYQLGLKLHE
ncbi:prolyl oligopeptidase [Phaffia rhodozyma]|uniref:Prolyl endopeptidase n=1 Tax=Phaffia rhodozyma TaxID=264483 RepID=A0A0F7SJ18_PHARH|nr:prolyl oligopeptidase [Phaffia rhodozyma]